MNISLPEKAEYIINRLRAHGHEAYAVGGCGRDALLGRIPEDWDITTAAKPGEIKAIFPRTVDTGIAHGTVTVLLGGESFEVTTFRTDGEYEDMRHPKEVHFVPDLKEDLLRRDFTVNAMAYSRESGLVDLYGGLDDLRDGVLRCVGEARERFSEDALRMLRAVRFSAQLDFSVEDQTKQAIEELAGNIAYVSKERIQTELSKLVLSDHPEKLVLACETGICRIVLPAFQDLFEANEGRTSWQIDLPAYSFDAVRSCPKEVGMRLCALLYEALQQGEEKSSGIRIRQILKDLKFDNRTIREAKGLAELLDESPAPDPVSIRRALSVSGADIFEKYLCLLRAFNEALTKEAGREGKKESGILLAMAQEEKNVIDNMTQCFTGIMERGDCVSLETLAVGGKDLLDAGMAEGKEVGELLRELLELVLEDPEKNTKECLFGYVRRQKG